MEYYLIYGFFILALIYRVFDIFWGPTAKWMRTGAGSRAQNRLRRRQKRAA